MLRVVVKKNQAAPELEGCFVDECPFRFRDVFFFGGSFNTLHVQVDNLNFEELVLKTK